MGTSKNTNSHKGFVNQLLGREWKGENPSEEHQGYAQPYKRHISAHMCTIENTAKLCKGTLEAV
jgi:hypothetical protein